MLFTADFSSLKIICFSQKAKEECVAGEPGLFALELLNFITPPGKWAALISKTIGLAHL